MHYFYKTMDGAPPMPLLSADLMDLQHNKVGNMEKLQSGKKKRMLLQYTRIER
jgi:hypothetical protein